MNRKNIVAHVVGARPNFVKAAPLINALYEKDLSQVIIHTGQHYSKNLSGDFFEILNIPEPDYHLSVGSGTHALQTSEILKKIEPILLDINPDLLIVYGDVNSTVAASLAASKLQIKIAHIESGLRSFDRNMPEEINRVIVDHICNYHFVTEESGLENLAREGIEKSSIFYVGNTMIDTLKKSLEKAVCSEEEQFALLTCHRPSNVDSKEGLLKLLDICKTTKTKIIFPVHPRTKLNLEKHGLLHEFEKINNLTMKEPLSYTEFLGHMKSASFVLTDSGGIQEETTALGVPCLTLRDNTERPSTIDIGTNILIKDADHLQEQIKKILDKKFKKGKVPKNWDGFASKRISNIIEEIVIQSS